MYDDLVKKLRVCVGAINCNKCEWRENCYPGLLEKQAADAIEELTREYESVSKDLVESVELCRKLRKPKWIPVTERLPKGGDDSGAVCENVCLLMDDGTVSCGWMNGITKKVYYLNARDDVIIKAPLTRVTNWMPLPEPPKEE